MNLWKPPKHTSSLRIHADPAIAIPIIGRVPWVNGKNGRIAAQKTRTHGLHLECLGVEYLVPNESETLILQQFLE
ncbi:MAG: hypothetical protein WAO02_00985 [Verrucomicrobiia bacterium]